MAVSSKYTQDLSVEIVFYTFSCKWFLCFYFWAVIWSYIFDLFAALHELASASTRTLLKLASSVRALLKPYGDTLKQSSRPNRYRNKNFRFLPTMRQYFFHNALHASGFLYHRALHPHSFPLNNCRHDDTSSELSTNALVLFAEIR